MNTHDIFTGDILYTNETKMTSKPNALCNAVGQWVSSFLTAHQHNIGYAVPDAVGQQNIIWFWYRGLAKVANNNWWHHWAVFEKYQ